MTARGVRNNNPGNLDYNPKIKWQGLAANPLEEAPASGRPPRFARFKSPVYGIRAIAVTLITYADKYGINTVQKAINRWAPPNENDTGAYAKHVAKKLGVGVNEIVDFHDYFVLRAMVETIIEHENGLKSFLEVYTHAQIDKALVLAGIEPPKKPVTKSKTIKGATLAGSGVTLTAITDVVQQTQGQIEPLIPYAETLKLVFLGLALLGVALTVYAKLQDRKRGL
jgi:hypothetical protein